MFAYFKAYTLILIIRPTATVEAITEQSKRQNISEPPLGLHTDRKRFWLVSPYRLSKVNGSA